MSKQYLSYEEDKCLNNTCQCCLLMMETKGYDKHLPVVHANTSYKSVHNSPLLLLLLPTKAGACVRRGVGGGGGRGGHTNQSAFQCGRCSLQHRIRDPVLHLTPPPSPPPSRPSPVRRSLSKVSVLICLRCTFPRIFSYIIKSLVSDLLCNKFPSISPV
jgi:hypothetical protein